MSLRRFIRRIHPGEFQSFFGHHEANLTSLDTNILLQPHGKLGYSWLESCFLDPKSFETPPDLIVETKVKPLSPSPASLFLLYFPQHQVYLGFQTRRDFIYALISRPHWKYQHYRHKEEKYRALVKQGTLQRCRDWKKKGEEKGANRRFLNYSIYWLWKEECRIQKWDLLDYTAFLLFRQDCHSDISGKLGQYLHIKYGTRETTFAHNKWQRECREEHYKEWKEFCQWKQGYYHHRRLHYESHPENIWERVARTQRQAILTMNVSPYQVNWKVDGYYVYTYTHRSPLHRFHVGVGIGCDLGIREEMQKRDCYSYSLHSCHFTSIDVYALVKPLQDSCITTYTEHSTVDTSSDESRDTPCESKYSCNESSISPPCHHPNHTTSTSTVHPNLEVTQYSLQDSPTSSSTVAYCPGHPLSAGATTSAETSTVGEGGLYDLSGCVDLTILTPSNC